MEFVDKWTPGETKLAVWAECCPKCGALEVAHKGRRKAGSAVVYWRCCICQAKWKGWHVKVSRGTVIK